MFFDAVGFVNRSAWQWQPTLEAHDPSPPLPLEDAPDAPPEVELQGNVSVGGSDTSGFITGPWKLGGTSTGVGLTGALLLPGSNEFPSTQLYPGTTDVSMRVAWKLSGTSVGVGTTLDDSFAGVSVGLAATGFWQLPDPELVPSATTLPGVRPMAELSVEEVPQVYEKTGAATTGALAKGADVFQATETATVTTGTLTRGTDVKEAPRTGAATSAARVSGVDVFEATESGAATTRALAAGVSVKESPGKAGIATAGSLARGVSTQTANRAAVVTTQAVTSGADVFQAVETGRALAGTKAGGSASTTEPITFVDYVGPLALVLNEAAHSLTVAGVSHGLEIAAPVRSVTVADSAHSLTVAATVQTTMTVSEVTHGLEVDEPERAIEIDEPARVLEVVA